MSSRTLIRGGAVLTLGAKTPNLVDADVLLEDGLVGEVGRGLRARDAEVVDATDAIVMPGFVDTHRHVWKTLLRNQAGDGPHGATTPPPEEQGRSYGPDDVYAATLIGLLGAIEAGITSVVDWADISSDAPSTEAALQAHTDAGLRSVFVHAAAPWAEGPDDGSTLRRLVADRPSDGAGPILAFGSPDPQLSDPGALSTQWALARELGLRIHVHASGRGVVAALADQGLLGADVTLVHCSGLGDDDLDAIATHRATVSLAPAKEMAVGLAAPPLQELIDRGVRPGLGVDDELLTPGDLFAQMRSAQSLQRGDVFDRKLSGKAGLPDLLSTREVIRYATVDGAKVAGLGEVTGTLEPGRHADVVVLRADRPNIFPINDPIGAVVWGMDASNVDHVFVGGRARMRDGVLDADVERARGLALAAHQRLAPAAVDLLESGDGGTR